MRPHQGELQCAGYRCGAHSQRVNVHLKLLQFFLDGDAELLFLIHYQKPKVLELHALAYYLVCPHKDIDLAFGQVGQYLLCLFGRAGSRQVVDLTGKSLRRSEKVTKCW